MKTEVLIVCKCGRPHVFKRPSVVLRYELRVEGCACHRVVTHIWYEQSQDKQPEPTRFSLLEVD